jgi:hypothetical protein
MAFTHQTVSGREQELADNISQLKLSRMAEKDVDDHLLIFQLKVNKQDSLLLLTES